MTPSSATAISEAFLVRTTNQKMEVSKSDLDRIDRIWFQMLESNPASNIFDGKVLCVVQASGNELVCRAVPYRFFYAQRIDPALRQRLNLRAAAVSGITFIGNAVVMGRRSRALTQYPNCFELVPSGSIDGDFVQPDGTINYRQQLAHELAEELKPEHKGSMSIQSLALLYDDAEATIDLCCRIDLPDDTVIPKSTKEYTELLKLSHEDLKDFVRNHQGEIVPVTTELLRFSGLKLQFIER